MSSNIWVVVVAYEGMTVAMPTLGYQYRASYPDIIDTESVPMTMDNGHTELLTYVMCCISLR
jgi:hypothetical protein